MGQLVDTVTAFPWWEPLAVLLGVLYLVLAARENYWCWPAAFVSTLIFLFLFWDATLVMQTGLQCYYLAMAVYGWYRWRRHGDEGPVEIHSFGTAQHLVALGLVAVATLLSYLLLDTYFDSAQPLLDSFTTWAAVLTTWMVAHKILENWLYWLVIDAVSIPLYLERGLMLTAALFAMYLVIVVYGYFAWRRLYRNAHHAKA